MLRALSDTGPPPPLAVRAAGALRRWDWVRPTLRLRSRPAGARPPDPVSVAGAGSVPLPGRLARPPAAPFRGARPHAPAPPRGLSGKAAPLRRPARHVRPLRLARPTGR